MARDRSNEDNNRIVSTDYRIQTATLTHLTVMIALYPLLRIRILNFIHLFFFFSSRRRHTRYWRDWSSDVCSSDLGAVHHQLQPLVEPLAVGQQVVELALADDRA